MDKRKGAVLIVVLGVLAILALLATTFATLQMTERRVARNYLDMVRAKLLAQSGVEHVLAELQRMAQLSLIPGPGPQPARYWGDDLDEEGPGAGSVEVKLRDARNPSFAVEVDGNPSAEPVTPKQVLVEGRPRGFSGVMSSGTYAKNGDMYVLKVTDASGKIYVNEGVNHSGGNDSTGSRNLRRILNRLGSQSTVGVPGFGDRVLTNRPSAGFRSIVELKSFLSDDEYAKVNCFITARAWVDHHVANPVPFTAAHAQAVKAEFGIEYYRGSPATYRFGRGVDYLGSLVSGELQIYSPSSSFPPSSLAHGVYAMDELNPQWIEVTSRAPVNVNEARREVLIALLADLRGVFLSERRRSNVDPISGGYHWLSVRHTFSPANMNPKPIFFWEPYCNGLYDVPEGDELGFLYETYPILGVGSGVGISASVIADEIIACRNGQTSKFKPALDYGTQPWSGPFRTWRQFDAFCDNLVTIGALEDPRPIYFDHKPNAKPGNITGNTELAASDFQRKVASQAIADVLKANFNPNLHLNELNPDRNLYRLVDKTDLVVNSTEFIFTSHGYYDVESVGRILRPWDNGDDALKPGVDNELVALAEIHAGVKIFDLIRETDQSEFAAGECSLRASSEPATNNNRSLEVGPEPDNGKGPEENHWGGYIAFATVGGNYRQQGKTKSKGDLLATPNGSGEGCRWGSTIHTHLAWDFDAHSHADGDAFRKDMGGNDVGPGDKVENFPDPGEAGGGPYDPVDNGGNVYRLARSFTTTPSSGLPRLPNLGKRAPMDLRIDGGYLERHGGLGYWLSPTSYVDSTRAKRGVISYWVKPNFFPERSGKPRLYVDMSRTGEILWPWNANFMQFWNAGHNYAPRGSSLTEGMVDWFYEGIPSAPFFGMGPLKPESMIFGVGYGSATGITGQPIYQEWVNTPCLNHQAHADSRPSLFSDHAWTHIALSWIRNTTQVWATNPTEGPFHYKIFVNGKLLPGTFEGVTDEDPKATLDSKVDWTTHFNGDRNSFRLGMVSKVDRRGPDYYHQNYPPDSTLDEVYFWNDPSYEEAAISQWLLGRYCVPRTAEGAVFVSQPIRSSTSPRTLPPPSVLSSYPPIAAPDAQILGISWTWYAEGSEQRPDGSWVPTLTDHGRGRILNPTVEASLVRQGASPVKDDGYSPLRDASGNPPRLRANEDLQYQLTLRVPGADLNTILLATPVVDDVTLFVSAPGSVFTYYIMVGN